VTITKIRVLSASGQIGSGFLESSFAPGIALEPRVIGYDAGRRMRGRNYMGDGKTHVPRAGVQGSRDDGDMYGGQQHAPLVTLQMPG